MQARVAELADIGPLVWSPAHGGHWIVTRFAEVHRVLNDPETFSSYPNNLVDAGQGRFIPLELDPPEHTAYRNVLQPMFNPSRMTKVEDEIRAIANRLIDGFIEQGECDFVPAFAHELPAQVFLALMGIVSAKWMWKNLRYSILVIFIIAAIITPTTDIMNMCIFAAPMILLYVVSIGVAFLVHPKNRRKRREAQEADQG